jgi:predicted porin
MKKTLIAALVCASFGVSWVENVNAQSSMLLYGLIDEGFLFNANARGDRQYLLASGNLQGSRFGFRGTEDLGGGWNTLFILENGFNLNTGALGQGGSLFGRTALVGLNGPYGSVTLGKQYEEVGEYIGGYTSANGISQRVGVGQWASAYGAHPGDLDNLDATNRVNNAIKYSSPVFAGFSVAGLYSLGGVAGAVSQNQIWSLAGTFNRGPVSTAVAITHIDSPNYSFFGNNPASNTATSPSSLNMTSPVYSGYASAGSQQIVAAGATYVFDRATVSAVYSNTRFNDVGTVGGAGLNPGNVRGTARFDIGEINATYRVTQPFQVGVAYHYTRGKSPADATVRYQQVNVAADYALSKRTDFYAAVIYQLAKGTDSTGRTAVASIYAITPSSNDHQLAALAGIRHKF